MSWKTWNLSLTQHNANSSVWSPINGLRVDCWSFLMFLWCCIKNGQQTWGLGFPESVKWATLSQSTRKNNGKHICFIVSIGTETCTKAQLGYYERGGWTLPLEYIVEGLAVEMSQIQQLLETMKQHNEEQSLEEISTGSCLSTNFIKAPSGEFTSAPNLWADKMKCMLAAVTNREALWLRSVVLGETLVCH